MIGKIKLLVATLLLSIGFGFVPISQVAADHGGVEQDDCLPGLIINEGHSACVEPTPENDPDNCASEPTPDRIEQCLGGTGQGDAGGPAGPGFEVGGTGTLEVGDTEVTCDDVENPESDNILCRLIQIVNFLSIGVAVVSAITVTIAGAQYVISRGDPNKTAKAINRLLQVGMAIVIYVFGWAFMNWLIPGGAL